MNRPGRVVSDDDGYSISRRRLVRATPAVLLAGFAGCASDPSNEGTTTTQLPGTGSGDGRQDGPTRETADRAEGARPDPDRTRTTTEAEAVGDGGGTTSQELDLREANVTGVEVEPTDGAYEFSVTLYHDDDGEDGYADWWRVETTNGEQLGRRELLHAHSTEPFTRSETITIPDGVSCVVVRGHDQTHGYGGQVFLVAVESGATVALDQGGERRAVDPAACP